MACGWFFQAGIGWQTNDRGVRWTTMRFPLDGALVTLTSAGADVWALLDTCPIGAVSCPQDLAKGFIYHATSATSLTWHRAEVPSPQGWERSIRPRGTVSWSPSGRRRTTARSVTWHGSRRPAGVCRSVL